jgi:hypothetical protein
VENKYVVVDLDGTLANVDHRTNLVKRAKPKFDTFFKLCHKDKVNEWCKQLILSLVARGFKVCIVSARPLSTEKMTAQWLVDNGLDNEGITLRLLRGDRDYTPDVELKRKWLRSLTTVSKKDILFVVDDRQRVVDMWREEGLVCLQCYAWKEFEAA